MFTLFFLLVLGGHWEGAVKAPGMEVRIAVDLVQAADGKLTGTFDNPRRGVTGFPLADVSASGETITFAIKAEGGGTFHGTVRDGKIDGTFTTKTMDGQALELPFALTRTGDAKTFATPKSPAVTKELEGRWDATLDVEGRKRAIGLVIRNEKDAATGAIVTAEGAEIAIRRIVQKGAEVTLDVANIGGVFEGTLKGGELAGTWSQSGIVIPVTFRRVAKTVVIAPFTP